MENLPPANTVAKQPEIIQRFKGERSAEGAIALEGKLYWAGGSGPNPNENYQIGTTTKRQTTDRKDIEENINEFALWIRGGKEPTDASKMNCWEAIFYSAYRAGVITKQWLVDIHKDAAKEGLDNAQYIANHEAALFMDHIGAGVDAYQKVLKKHLGFDNSQPITPTNRPKKGDIIFLNGLDHVVISLGTSKKGNEVMSLWIYPIDKNDGHFINTFQRTTLENIQRDWKEEYGYRFNERFASNPF